MVRICKNNNDINDITQFKQLQLEFLKVMKGFELGTFSAFDGALDVRLLGDLGRS